MCFEKRKNVSRASESCNCRVVFAIENAFKVNGSGFVWSQAFPGIDEWIEPKLLAFPLHSFVWKCTRWSVWNQRPNSTLPCWLLHHNMMMMWFLFLSQGDVFFYYGLQNFHQNLRRYMDSRDDGQMVGRLKNLKVALEPAGNTYRPCTSQVSSNLNKTNMSWMKRLVCSLMKSTMAWDATVSYQ